MTPEPPLFITQRLPGRTGILPDSLLPILLASTHVCAHYLNPCPFSRSHHYLKVPSPYLQQTNPQSVRGHPSIPLLPLSLTMSIGICKGTSVHFLTSPLVSHFPLSICIPHPHLCTISKDHTYSRRLSGLTVRRLPDSHSARTLAASDKPRTHWDRSM
jgi:hypothetical protein